MCVELKILRFLLKTFVKLSVIVVKIINNQAMTVKNYIIKIYV